MAMLTPTFLAITCLLDSCLIENKVYRSPLDGAVISCLFCVFPILAVIVWGGLSWENLPKPQLTHTLYSSMSAIGAGLAFAFHVILYFRTLYRLNDVSGAETFIGLRVLVVPLLAWLLMGEVLPVQFYAAFILAAVGVALQCLPALRQFGFAFLFDMLICVAAVSISMVLQANALQELGFLVSTIIFNLSCLSVAIVFLLINRALRQRVVYTLRNFPLLIVAGESLAVLALICSHRATQLSPSVSFVALIECLLPLIIIFFSFVLIIINRYAPVLSKATQQVLTLQVAGVPKKITAITLLLVSVSSLSISP